MDAIAKILPFKVTMDYFDWKNLACTNRVIRQLVNDNVTIDQTLGNRMYACIYGFLVNVFPGMSCNRKNIMGVKLRFLKENPYQNFSMSNLEMQSNVSIFARNVKECSTIGLAHKLGHPAVLYFGTKDTYHCFDILEAPEYRSLINDMIFSSLEGVTEVEIFHENVTETTFNAFLSQLTDIASKSSRHITVTLYRECIPENVLIYHGFSS